jgi:hypothetical protein
MSRNEAVSRQQPWIEHPRASMGVEEVSTFRIKKIDNGFLVMYAKQEGEKNSSRYVANASELGDCITAILVEMKLENQS